MSSIDRCAECRCSASCTPPTSNYCPKCQTGGKLLADRALSRLLKSDWPRSVDELEDLRKPRSED